MRPRRLIAVIVLIAVCLLLDPLNTHAKIWYDLQDVPEGVVVVHLEDVDGTIIYIDERETELIEQERQRIEQAKWEKIMQKKIYYEGEEVPPLVIFAQLIDENGRKIYIVASETELIEKELVRIEAAKAAKEGRQPTKQQQQQQQKQQQQSGGSGGQAKKSQPQSQSAPQPQQQAQTHQEPEQDRTQTEPETAPQDVTPPVQHPDPEKEPGIQPRPLQACPVEELLNGPFGPIKRRVQLIDYGQYLALKQLLLQNPDVTECLKQGWLLLGPESHHALIGLLEGVGSIEVVSRLF